MLMGYHSFNDHKYFIEMKMWRTIVNKIFLTYFIIPFQFIIFKKHECNKITHMLFSNL